MAHGRAYLFVLAAVMLPRVGNADERLEFLRRQMERAKDPRVRAQTALMLAAYDEPAAVEPLCAGLRDDNPLVRTASAKALGQLGEISAAGCVKPALSDRDGNVAEAARNALELLEGRRKPPQLYIALGKVGDANTQLDAELLQFTEQRLRSRLERMGSVFAPENEQKAAAAQVIKKRRLKGYYLRPELVNVGGALKLMIVCFTYPDRSLLGQVEVKASGGRAPDMIRALVPKVVQEAAETFEWSL